MASEPGAFEWARAAREMQVFGAERTKVNSTKQMPRHEPARGDGAVAELASD
jgi:hypothetical protein